MVTTVFIDDYLSLSHRYLVFDSSEMEQIEENWHKSDKLLVGLSKSKFFEGLTIWSELKPVHYKFLILRNFSILDEVPIKSRTSDCDVIRSLNFLIGCMIKCLAENADTHVNFLKIQRLSEDKMIFDYQASLLLELGEPPTCDRVLKVVVDNSKE